MEYEHIGFMEAVQRMANKVGISIEVDKKYQSDKQDKNYHLYEMYNTANKFYQNNLYTKDGINAKEYLKDRGFNDEIIKTFEVGLSSYDDKVYNLLKENKYKDEELIKVGICSKGEKRIHDTFINRIMFPIWDLDGKVVGFSGRVYNREDTSKYINSRESEIFKKGHILYNYHHAKEEIRKSKSVIIVEGFMDVIGLYKVGIKNVIATMGTAITSDQAQLIKKLSLNVILCFDGDEAGNKATISCSNELVKLGISPKIIRLENNYDPDEYVKIYGLDKFNKHLESPMSLIDYKFLIYKKDKNFNNSDDLSQYIKTMTSEISLIKDDILRELTIKKLSNETGVSIDTINNIINKEKKVNNVIVKDEITSKKVTLNKFQKAEERLLFYMLKHKEVIRIYDNHHCYISSQLYRYLANEIVYFYHKYDHIGIADFIAFLGDKKELVEATGHIINLNLPETYTQDEIMDYIEVLNQQAVEMEIIRLSKLFKSEDDPLHQAEIAKKITELKQGSDINGK
jgi:DNA primase